MAEKVSKPDPDSIKEFRDLYRVEQSVINKDVKVTKVTRRKITNPQADIRDNQFIEIESYKVGIAILTAKIKKYPLKDPKDDEFLKDINDLVGLERLYTQRTSLILIKNALLKEKKEFAENSNLELLKALMKSAGPILSNLKKDKRVPENTITTELEIKNLNL
jgi:hypothetical protein